LVALKTSTGKPDIVAIHAVGPKVAGLVKTCDGKTLRLGNEILDVSPDAVVIIDGKRGTLADIRPGMNATVQLSAETQRSLIVAILTAKYPRPLAAWRPR